MSAMSLLRQVATKNTATKAILQRTWNTFLSPLVESFGTKAGNNPTAVIYSEPHIPGRLGLGLAVNRMPGHHPRFAHSLSRNMIR